MPMVSLPIGSEAVDIPSVQSSQSFDPAALDGLLSGGTSESFSYGNSSGALTAKVVLILGKLAPTGTPVVSLSDGTDQYDVTLTTNDSAKRVEWNDIPVAFLSSFQVINGAGVDFASSGNSLTVIPL